MNIRNCQKGLAALVSAALLCLQAAVPAMAAGDTVVVRSAEDLTALSERCALDSWSRGKTVVLAADLSLASVEFTSIPTFGGTFDGRGHTISGLTLDGKVSPAGLFGVVQEGAVVKNLRVSGNVTPSGAGNLAGGLAGENRGLISNCTFSGGVAGENQVGGIAGLNGPAGRVEDCAVSGSVSGRSMTGGIAGENRGVIASCANRGFVNITSMDPGVDLSQLELNAYLLTPRALDAVNIATDTGGVAGFSSGMILSCTNDGLVGCRHVGYNVGGIAGRSQGFLSGCTNGGQVFGRKDVGGIVGQAEPDILLDLSEDKLALLRGQLSELEGLVDRAAADVQGASDDLSGQFGAVNSALDDVSGLAKTLTDRLSGYGDDMIGEINRGGDILDDALDRLSAVAEEADGLSGTVAKSLDEVERALGKLSDAGDYTGDIANELRRAADDLTEANRLLDAGTARLREGMEQLSAAAQAGDWEAARDALNGPVREGLDVLAGSSSAPGVPDCLDGAAAHLKSALSYAERTGSMAQSALDSLADAADLLSGASRRSETVLEGTRDLIDFLAAADPIRFSKPNEAVGSASDDLFDALNLLGDRLDSLNGAAGSASGRLTGDIRAINHQFSAIMNNLLDIADGAAGAGDGEIISDTSEADVEAVVNGKVRGCVNRGKVSGDLCVGGVAGSMAVEYELDPEDDTFDADAAVYRRAYELKAVLQSCVNEGEVLSRRNWAGGICGRVSLGLVSACQSYGTVGSESGDCVGGIAGFSTGAVRDCWSKCTLSGGQYVGGVVGSTGVEGGREGGVIAGCTAFVSVPEFEQYAGAISGVDRGSFEHNVFVEGPLAGLDRVSLAGQAESVSYEELLEREDLPAPFRRLTLRFLADGAVLKTVSFPYGGSFGDNVFPALPEKEGQYARWDRDDLTDLRFDTDVTAVYTPCLTAIPSEERRGDGRPVLFAEGRFDGGARLSLLPAGEEFPVGSTPASLRREVELWRLKVPRDGASAHTLRYLSPSGSPEDLEVYALEGGFWVRLEAEQVGSYLVFEAGGEEPVLAVVSRTSIWWIWLLAAAVLAALVPAALALTKRWKPGKKREAGAKAAPDPKKKKRRRILAAVCAAAVLLAAAGVYLAASGLLDSAAAAKLLYDYAGREEFAMDLSVRASVGERRLSADTRLVRLQAEGRGITVARQLGAAAYYCGGVVYLENGAAFQLSDGSFPDYGGLLDTVRLLYRAGDIELFQSREEKIYTLAVEGEEARGLLRALFPGAADAAALDRLNVELAARSGTLYELRFTADGTLAGGGAASLTARLRARESWETPEIPEAVLKAIRAGGAGAAENSAGLLRLLTAWGKLNLADPLSVQLSLSADCGPLKLDDELELFRTWAEGKQVGCVRRAGRSLYFTEKAAYTEGGLSVDLAQTEDALSRTKLLELAYGLCLRGEAGCVERNGGYLYTLRLGPEELEEAAGAILPGVRALDVSLTGGSLEIEVSEDSIRRVWLSCEGGLEILSMDVPVTLACTLGFEPREFALPEAVAGAVRMEQ